MAPGGISGNLSNFYCYERTHFFVQFKLRSGSVMRRSGSQGISKSIQGNTKACAGNQTGRIGPATGEELKKRGQGYPFPGAGFRQNLRPIRPLRFPLSKALYRERRRNSGERPASSTSAATVVGSYPIDTPSLPAHELVSPALQSLVFLLAVASSASIFACIWARGSNDPSSFVPPDKFRAVRKMVAWCI